MGLFSSIGSWFGKNSDALGSLVTGVLSGGSGIAGNILNYQQNKNLQNHQYQLGQQGLLESPTNARQGLVNAGYNPILAINGGSSITPATGYNGSVSTSIPDIGSSFTNAYQTLKLNRQSVNNQTLTSLTSAEQSNAQASLAREQAITEQAKRIQMDFQNAMYDVEKHLKQKQLSWFDKKAYSEIYELMQRAENYSAIASISRYNALTERQNASTNAMNADTNRLNAKTNVAKAIGTGIGSALGLYGLNKLKYAPYIKNTITNAKKLGVGGFVSSKAKYFTSLH